MRKRLGEFQKGGRGRIVEIVPHALSGDSENMIERLMEMGLLVGSLIEVVHEAPFGGDPLAVRVRGALIALRRNEANHVWVEYE